MPRAGHMGAQNNRSVYSEETTLEEMFSSTEIVALCAHVACAL